MKPQAIFLATALLLGTAGIGLPVAAAPTPPAPLLLAQSKTPQRTYMTPQRDPNQIAVDITDAEFRVAGIMQRSYGNFYVLSKDGVQVTYNRDNGNVVVLNSVTGTEFYNYTFTEASRAPAPTGSSFSSNAPESTTLTPIGNGQISAYITDGEFSFSGALTRTSGNTYVGEDGRVRVIYDQSAGRIVIINVVTGTEFYNYAYSGATVGALPGGEPLVTGLSSGSTNSRTPESTTMTPINTNQISVYIVDGEFSYSGALTRSSGNMFIGQDSQVRVMYDQGTSRITVINKVTGTEFYNYIYSTVNEGSL